MDLSLFNILLQAEPTDHTSFWVGSATVAFLLDLIVEAIKLVLRKRRK